MTPHARHRKALLAYSLELLGCCSVNVNDLDQFEVELWLLGLSVWCARRLTVPAQQLREARMCIDALSQRIDVLEAELRRIHAEQERHSGVALLHSGNRCA